MSPALYLHLCRNHHICAIIRAFVISLKIKLKYSLIFFFFTGCGFKTKLNYSNLFQLKIVYRHVLCVRKGSGVFIQVGLRMGGGGRRDGAREQQPPSPESRGMTVVTGRPR